MLDKGVIQTNFGVHNEVVLVCRNKGNELTGVPLCELMDDL